MKKIIKPLVLAFASTTLALPAMAELSGHVGSTLTQPTESGSDTQLTFEVGALYEFESGVYGGALFTTNDVLDSDSKFRQSLVELTAGFTEEINDLTYYDLGLTYERQLSSGDKAELVELYFGAGYAITPAVEVNLYGYKNLRSSVDESRLELGVNYSGAVVDLFTLLTKGFEDDESELIELGIGKEFIPNNYISALYAADLDSSKNNYIEIAYTYSF